MKSMFAKLTLAALAALTSASLHAQTEAIVTGRATIVLTPAVLQQFAALGVSITNLPQAGYKWMQHGREEPMPNGTNILPALEGAIDLQTSSNEVVYAGGYQIKVGGTTIQVRNLTLDLVGHAAVFSGILIENGTFIGRETIFSINAQGPPSLPIVPKDGTISHNGLSLSFEQPFVSLIDSAVGNSGLNTSTQIGTLDLFSVLAPLSASSSPAPRNW